MSANGTFTGAGQSATVVSRKTIAYSLGAFASTGSVNIERRLNGADWKVLKTVTEASDPEDKEGLVDVSDTMITAEFRLNCTAAGGNIPYWLG